MAEKKPTASELASEILRAFGFKEINGAERQVLRFWRGDFYLWREGIYKRLSSDEMKAVIVRFLGNTPVEAAINLLENIKLHLMAATIMDKDRVPNTWINSVDGTGPVGAIVTEGGILSFKDGKVEVTPNTPELFALSKVPYKYDPSAGCPRWEQFLGEVVADDDLRSMLQQWAAYLLVPTQEYQCFLLCIGEAATGKGTFARTMKGMLGKESCSDVPLRRFTDKFSMYLTYGKRLNVAGDAEQELTPQVEAVIKTWTGRDGLDFERKYADGFTAEATAKLMILSNDFPSFTDKSMGTWRRLKVVPFNRDNREYMDPNLDEELQKELPGILNWAIAGLPDLRANRGISTAKSSNVLWEQFKEESNPAAMFLKGNYYWDYTYMLGVPPASVYDKYREWCNRKGYQRMSEKTFGKEVRRIFPDVVKRRLGGRDSRFYAYVGLKLRTDVEL